MSRTIPIATVVLPAPDQVAAELAILVGLIREYTGCEESEAVAALNRIFAAGGRTSSPWQAPYMLLELVVGELRLGRSLAASVAAAESDEVIVALDDYFELRRRR